MQMTVPCLHDSVSQRNRKESKPLPLVSSSSIPSFCSFFAIILFFLSYSCCSPVSSLFVIFLLFIFLLRQMSPVSFMLHSLLMLLGVPCHYHLLFSFLLCLISSSFHFPSQADERDVLPAAFIAHVAWSSFSLSFSSSLLLLAFVSFRPFLSFSFSG